MKRFSLLTCLVALLSFAACTEELESPVASGEEVNVTFTADLANGVQTRAFSTGTQATNLSYAVYAAENDTFLYEGTETVTNLSATVNLTLVKGKKYDIVFWAQAAAAPYTFSATNKIVTVDYQNLKANQESYDAFYAVKSEYSTSTPTSEPIKLYRPFAQINVGTDDLAELTQNSVTLETTSLTVKNIFTTLNLLDGSVDGETAVTYAAAAVPGGETFPKEHAKASEGKKYDYVGMDYVLVDSKALVEVDFTANVNGASPIVVSLNNVPVQRNYRTNIYGSLLTTTSDWYAEIIKDYNTPDTDFEVKNVTTVDGAQSAIAAGATGVVITDALTEDETLAIPSTTNEEISITIEDAGNKTVTIEAAAGATDTPAEVNITVANAANVVVNLPNSTVYVNGVRYENLSSATLQQTLYLQEGVEIGNLTIVKGNVVVENGAKVTAITRAENNADDYTYIYNIGGTVPDGLDEKIIVFSGEEAALRVAMNADGGYTLHEDIALSYPLIIGTEFELNLGEHSITPKGNSLSFLGNYYTNDALVVVKRGAKLTLSGNGKIDTGENSSLSAAVKLTIRDDDATATAKLIVNGNPQIKGRLYGIAGNGSRHNTEITINSGKLEGGACAIFHPQYGQLTVNGGEFTSGYAAVEMRAGTLDITDGTFTSTSETYETKPNSSGNTTKGAAIALSQHTTDKPINLTISGGTFTGHHALSEIDVQDDKCATTVAVTGGTFNGVIESQHCTKFIAGGKFSDQSAMNYITDDSDAEITIAKGIAWGSKVYYIYDADGLVYANTHYFSKGDKSYKLMADIDMSEVKNYVSNVGVATMTFDGNGHKISNWAAAGNSLFVGQFNHSPAQFTNLTLENCSVTVPENASGNDIFAGMLIGYSDNGASSTITINNCHVIGGSVTSGHDYAGGLVGYLNTAGESIVSGCSVKNVTISGNGSTGGIAGHIGTNAKQALIEKCSVTGCTVKCTEANKDWRVGAIAGTVQGVTTFTNNTVSNNTFDQTTPGTDNAEYIYDKTNNVFGRYVSTGTSKFTIDGVEVKK